MFIIGIDQTQNTEREVIHVIKELGEKNGILCECLSERKMISYMKYRGIEAQEYVLENYKEHNVELLLVDISRRSLKEKVYKTIDFDLVLILPGVQNGVMRRNKCIYYGNKMLSDLKSGIYILPDTYKLKNEKSIFYGWSQKADISFTSSEIGPDGELSIQCLVSHNLNIMKKSITAPLEFSFYGFQNELILLGVAGVFLLTGHDMNHFIF